MALTPGTAKQVPEHSIMDKYNKQTYLGNQFSVSATFTVGATEIPLLLMRNVLSGSPSTALSYFNNLLKVVEKTAAQSIILNAYIAPTVTANGTAVTPIVNLRPAWPTVATALITSAPTVSANGNLVESISAAALSVSSSDILKIIDQGQSLLITGIASAAATSATVILQWYEL